ncbi:MAG: hypothetical protein EOO65_03450 [Methanosarcinales archaeon]|nr:MAG: hypothetical protein EOO65_03450 [Methanosarcinales archaeon]
MTAACIVCLTVRTVQEGGDEELSDKDRNNIMAAARAWLAAPPDAEFSFGACAPPTLRTSTQAS